MSFSRNRGGTTSTSSQTSVRNLNIQDVEGITVADVGGAVSIVQSDQGAIATAERIAGGALALADYQGERELQAFEGAGALVREIFGRSLEEVGRVVERGQTTIGNTVSALNQVAREQSTSSDERVETIARTGLIAGAVVVAIVAGAMFFRKG